MFAVVATHNFTFVRGSVCVFWTDGRGAAGGDRLFCQGSFLNTLHVVGNVGFMFLDLATVRSSRRPTSLFHVTAQQQQLINMT